MASLRDRIEGVPALAGVVFGAAKLAQLTREGTAFQGNRAAFILPLGIRGAAADAVTGLYRQTIERLVGVVLMVRNVGDGTGEKALAEIEPIIDAVIAAVVGWGPDEAIGVFTLARGELVSIDRGVIQYQLDFALEDQLRIAA